MTDEQFHKILSNLKRYLEAEKTFVQNPLRTRDMIRALEIMHEIFPQDEIEVKDDPLQLGSVILSVKMPYMVVRGARELDLFSELAEIIDNFEVTSQMNEEDVRFSVVMQEVYIRVPQGN